MEVTPEMWRELTDRCRRLADETQALVARLLELDPQSASGQEKDEAAPGS